MNFRVFVFPIDDRFGSLAGSPVCLGELLFSYVDACRFMHLSKLLGIS